MGGDTQSSLEQIAGQFLPKPLTPHEIRAKVSLTIGETDEESK